MTVASLWKALDTAKSGKCVGADELAAKPELNATPLDEINPWNYNKQPKIRGRKNRATLAVDLSIWICESLTSHAMTENNQNPSLHLVFSRTIKLLSLGIKLIFVIEGKRRIRGEYGEEHKFHKRRSGNAFWKACNDCKQMLELLGVPVVRAKAEGEALCALLNQRGIVDGVISNDGDCLLFGAKTVYTKFSIENMENSQVVRYDLSNLKANAVESEEDDGVKSGTLHLSREDLISFALLTGSDLAGPGLSKVGHMKAIRFIKKCQDNFPISKRTAAIDELRSWARAASTDVIDYGTCYEEVVPKKCKKDHNCSRCCHPGSKRQHEKNGCEICGTAPGEPCVQVTSEDKFRKALREKALGVKPRFDPAQVVEAYMLPNDNQIPAQFSNTKSDTLSMGQPRLRELLNMPLIVKGRSLEASREYVKQAVTRLMARNELFSDTTVNDVDDRECRQKFSRERPVPLRINRKLVQNQVASYEVQWVVKATITSNDGEGLDGYEYSSIEPCLWVERRFSDLIAKFEEDKVERKKQGDAEQRRRRAFLENLLGGESLEKQGYCASPIRVPKNDSRKRQFFFENTEKNCDDQQHGCTEGKVDQSKRLKISNANVGGGDDVAKLLRGGPLTPPVPDVVILPVMSKQEKRKSKNKSRSKDERKIRQDSYEREERKARRVSCDDNEFNQEELFSCISALKSEPHYDEQMEKESSSYQRKDSWNDSMITPSGEGLFCDMGGFKIEITPIISNRGCYPPRHIFVHKNGAQ